jgi:hypothetical protein
MHGSRAGGASILDPCRRLEAKGRIGLEHERRREVLLHEAAIEVAEIDLVDLLRPHPGIRERRRRRLHDQALDVAALVLAEGQMPPADDAGCHAQALLLCPG